MAPEVAAASSHYDGSSDVFSFGLVMYDMYHCTTPFEALPPLQAAMKYVCFPSISS